MFLKWIVRRLIRRTTEATLVKTLDTPDALETVQKASSELRRLNATKSSRSFFRWSYLATRGAIVAVVWALFAFCLDPLLRVGMVTSLESQLGAKADIGRVVTSLAPPLLRIEDVHLANRSEPGRNLIEFASFEGRLDGAALLKRRFVIDEGTLTGLRWDTERTDSGLLDDATGDSGSGLPPALENGLERFGRAWVDDLLRKGKQELDPRYLESIQLAGQLKVEWSRDFDDLENRAKQFEPRVRAVRDKAKGAKGNVLQQVEIYRAAAVDVDRLLRDVAQMKQDAAQLIPKAQNDLTRLNAAKDRDKQTIQRKIDLVKLDPDALSEFLLGRRAGGYLSKGIEWLRWSRQRRKEFQNQPQPARSRGTNVLFPRQDRLPELLVRRLHITGQGRIADTDVTLRGTVSDLASDPKLYGRPTVVELAGTGNIDVHLSATLDQTTSTPRQHFVLTVARSQTTDFEVGTSDALQLAVSGENLRWTLDVTNEGDQLHGQWSLTQTPVRVTPLSDQAETPAEVAQIVRDVVATVHDLQASGRISGSVEAPKLTFQSNLGNTLASGMADAVQRLAAAQQQQLAAKLDAKLAREQQQLTRRFNQRYAGLLEDLGKHEKLIQDAMNRVGSNSIGLDRLFRR